MTTAPSHMAWIFLATTAIAIYLFYRASGHSRLVLGLVLVQAVVQSLVALTGYYAEVLPGLPPRFALVLLGPILGFVWLLATARGRQWMDGLSLGQLTLMHTVRIPIELLLYALSVVHLVPELMTFEGRNFDIIAGLTAPLIWWMVVQRSVWPRWALLIWNFVCLGLLLNIAVHGLLSAPTDLQVFAFDQPNVALAYFPFVLLPGVLVPMVIVAHVAAIRQLWPR